MDPKVELRTIAGVEISPLKKLTDERGSVMHMLKSKQPGEFLNVGEIYFSLVNPGFVKGWKYHKEISQQMVVPTGSIRIVLYDDRPESITKGAVQAIDFGDCNYALLTIPPRIWYAFASKDGRLAIIANATSAPHRPEESLTKPLDSSDFTFKVTTLFQ